MFLCERVAIEFLIRQQATSNAEFVGHDRSQRAVAVVAEERHDVVLIDAVAADAEAAHQGRALVQRRAAGEEHDPVLIGDVQWIAEVSSRIEGVEAEHRLNQIRGDGCSHVLDRSVIDRGIRRGQEAGFVAGITQDRERAGSRAVDPFGEKRRGQESEGAPATLARSLAQPGARSAGSFCL